MSPYTFAEFRYDLNVLCLSGDFGVEEVQAVWRARVRKMHTDVGGDLNQAQDLNVAKDRVLGWIEAGRPRFPESDGRSTADSAPPAPKKRWKMTLKLPPLTFEGHPRVFGIPVPVLFAGYGVGMLLLFIITSINYAGIADGAETLLINSAPLLIVWAMCFRALWLMYGFIDRDIVKRCPKCKQKGVLRKVSDVHQYSDWHSHESEVGHGRQRHKETKYSTTHHFTASYACEKCGHSFMHNYKRFVMNNASFDSPHDLIIGVLRMILQV